MEKTLLTFLDRKNILSKLSRDFVIFSSCFLPFPCVLITVFLDKKDKKDLKIRIFHGLRAFVLRAGTALVTRIIECFLALSRSSSA